MVVNGERSESPTEFTGAVPKAEGLAAPSGRPADPPSTKILRVAGTVKAISLASLTLETKAGESTFDLRDAVIRVGIQAATAAHLREGDEVRVSYVRSDEQLVAKTVTRLVKRVP